MMKFILLASLALATALPAPSLSKRSFSARANGRGITDPIVELARVRAKYRTRQDREIVVIDSKSPPPAPPSSTLSASGSGLGSSTSSASASLPTYANSTGTATSPMTTSTRGSEDGEVSADPEDNESEYLSPVTVGGQRLNLDFDTGSADLWVYGSSLIKDYPGHSYFNSSKSSTWQDLEGATWEISYGDGSGAYGTVGFDTVDVGGSTVQKQAVEVASAVSESFGKDTVSDGLLGLAFSSINQISPKPQKTFFDNVMDNLTLPVFTADLTETDGTGSYDFGTIDKSKYSGDIHYTDIDNSQGWWQVTPSKYAIDGQEVPCDGETCSAAIADTGTSLLYLNDSVVSAFYEKVEGSSKSVKYGGYVYPCSANNTLPSISVGFGDYLATIKGADLTYTVFSDSDPTCFGGLQSSADSGIDILGDVFLKHFFAVFDAGNLRFGIAEKDS